LHDLLLQSYAELTKQTSKNLNKYRNLETDKYGQIRLMTMTSYTKQ